MIPAVSQTPYSATTSSHRHAEGTASPAEPTQNDKASMKQATELDAADQKRLIELRTRDREVRAHEQAHLWQQLSEQLLLNLIPLH